MIVTFSYGVHLSANRIYYNTISHLTCVGGVRRGIKKIQSTKPKYLIIETLSLAIIIQFFLVKVFHKH